MLTTLTTYSNLIITSITLLFSVAILIVAIRIPRQIFKRQMFSELLAEYRSTEMGVAIKKIWGFAQWCLKNDKRMDLEYERISRLDELRCLSVQDWQNTLHYHRRQVSQFYQQLASLGFGFLRKQVRKNISTGDLRIIRIVFELEMYAVPKTFNIIDDDQIEKVLPTELLPQTMKKLHRPHLRMYQLYLKSRTLGWKDRTACEQRFYRMVSWLKDQERHNLGKGKNTKSKTGI